MQDEKSQVPFEPELGQMMFGNAYDALNLGANERYVSEKLYELLEIVGSEWGYGEDLIKNDVFEMHPYWWGGCTCGFDEKDFVWSKEHSHTETCFFNRYHAEEKRLQQEEVPFNRKNDLMTKWAKVNGYADAPNGMAVHCDCGVDQAYTTWRNDNGHASDCREVIPNFKCGDIEIRWYKNIGRGMSVNREVSREELREIFGRCRESLK